LKPHILIVLPLLVSSTVFAAERYTEVWNPPEAQASKSKAKARNVVPVQTKKKRKSMTTVKKVADKTSVVQTAPVPRTKTAPKQSEPSLILPRKIGPNGQVLRVAYPGG
jgi:hypothetical protein